jgi:shikimate kinase
VVNTRRVVLVCGPPGAGKTTLARSYGLAVYDLDDERWGNSEKLFRTHLALLAKDHTAQAVVIRAGATQAARAKARALVDATETVIVTTSEAECVRRVIDRNRPRPPMRVQIAAVKKWWQTYEPDSPGTVTPTTGVTARDW